MSYEAGIEIIFLIDNYYSHDEPNFWRQKVKLEQIRLSGISYNCINMDPLVMYVKTISRAALIAFCAIVQGSMLFLKQNILHRICCKLG
jgi:hypothetical protein